MVGNVWVALHKRADAILVSKNRDQLDQSEIDYLIELFSRKIIWGTPTQCAFVEKVEEKLKESANKK